MQIWLINSLVTFESVQTFELLKITTTTLKVVKFVKTKV